jgi:hypothetical protein
VVTAVGTRGADVPIRPSKRSSRPGCDPKVAPLDPGSIPSNESSEPGLVAIEFRGMIPVSSIVGLWPKHTPDQESINPAQPDARTNEIRRSAIDREPPAPAQPFTSDAHAASGLYRLCLSRKLKAICQIDLVFSFCSQCTEPVVLAWFATAKHSRRHLLILDRPYVRLNRVIFGVRVWDLWIHNC